MRITEGITDVSASDLVAYLNCKHLSELNRAVAEGRLKKPSRWDPFVQLLQERGAIHEQNYVEHLRATGLAVTRIEGVEISPVTLTQTREAMATGADVIVQGALAHDGMGGRVDVLRRVETPSALGAWSYEVVDTKLARETKAGSVLQLCVYSDLLSVEQEKIPELMYIVVPWVGFEPHAYRYSDFAAYYRRLKRELQLSLKERPARTTYPDPIDHCDVCRWSAACEQRRRQDDHLSLVAGISKVQINELTERGVTTIERLSAMAIPLTWKPERGSAHSYVRIREQARLQVEGRNAGESRFETLPVEIGFGLTRLPDPNAGDVFLDLEGDPFVGEHGLEYLFGYQYTDDDGSPLYVGDWAFSREDEKRGFERFVDFVVARWDRFPGLHVYHYAPYEPAALKRLMGRYATRQDEIDRMLRAELFVDLYHVVRHGVRASVESYSIKKLEAFYGFNRNVALADANSALSRLSAEIELRQVPSVPGEIREVVRGYNEDDCASTRHLRDWLESVRSKLVTGGVEVPRPTKAEDGEPKENVAAWLAKIEPLIAQLTRDVPVDVAARTKEQHARWLLANLLDWHRREQKAVWWEHFRLAALTADELLDERKALAGLVFESVVGGTAKAPIHRYRFSPQDADIRSDDDLRAVGGEKLGSVHNVSYETLTIDIKKRKDTASQHPVAMYVHKVVSTDVLAESLVRIGAHVAERGIEDSSRYLVARDLLSKARPRLEGGPLRRETETAIDAVVRLATDLKGGVLPIQGPPGTGKTYTAAHMICELARLGKRVGITANSHKVIRNLINTVIEQADKLKIELVCCQKADESESTQHRLEFADSNGDLIQAIAQHGHVGGATAWFWARPDAFELVDVLFVDEAAQMSLANVIAVSQAAKTVVLVGDPQQLDQPLQGSHPDGCDASALDHILQGRQTITPEQGLFLEQTWRLHPDICLFTSELFYAGRLRAKEGLSNQEIRSSGPITGSGLRYFPVPHVGNQSSSREEAQFIAALVGDILKAGATWVDRDKNERPVTLQDFLIIAPYNAQVFEIQRLLPGSKVGTVDKFQGQEAPIAIYSMTTSTRADAPRGMEFLYSLKRFNVATSRAKCVSILVGSPQVFEADCATPRQMQLANAFCRYLELTRDSH